MSEMQETLSIASRLESQHAVLCAVVQLLEHGRRRFALQRADLQWSGPANLAYIGARWMLDQEVIAALDALRTALDETSTALRTLGNRG